jgi:hypothetical protein
MTTMKKPPPESKLKKKPNRPRNSKGN